MKFTGTTLLDVLLHVHNIERKKFDGPNSSSYDSPTTGAGDSG